MPVLSLTVMRIGGSGLITYLLPSSIILVLITYVLKRRKTQAQQSLESHPQSEQESPLSNEKPNRLNASQSPNRARPHFEQIPRIHTENILRSHPRPRVVPTSPQEQEQYRSLPYPVSPPLLAKDFFPTPLPRPLPLITTKPHVTTSNLCLPYPIHHPQLSDGETFILTSSPTTYLPPPSSFSPSQKQILPFSVDSPNPSSFTSALFTPCLEPSQSQPPTKSLSFPPSTASSHNAPFSSSRRRSYTKTLSISSISSSSSPTTTSNSINGGPNEPIKQTSFSGDIVAGEGWRRHTRVYGGGVCVACEESQGRLRVLEAMNGAGKNVVVS